MFYYATVSFFQLTNEKRSRSALSFFNPLFSFRISVSLFIFSLKHHGHGCFCSMPSQSWISTTFTLLNPAFHRDKTRSLFGVYTRNFTLSSFLILRVLCTFFFFFLNFLLVFLFNLVFFFPLTQRRLCIGFPLYFFFFSPFVFFYVLSFCKVDALCPKSKVNLAEIRIKFCL